MATGVDARLMKSTKFPPEFSQKVDMQKVNLQVMKKWIASKISDILGSEDDVVIELVFNLIEGPRYPDIKSLQIQLTGFLDKDTARFCKDLWKLLLSAQSSPQGVPKELLEAKKLELIQEKIEADRAAENAKQRRGDWERRDREIPGKDGVATAISAIGEGEALEEEMADPDRQPHVLVTPGIHLGVTVTFHEADEEGVEPIMLDENRLPGHVQHRLHLDRARAAVAHHAALISQTGDEELHLRDKETGGRELAHPEEIRIGVARIDVVNAAAQLARPGQHLQLGNLRQQSGDVTLLQEVVRYLVADGPREASPRRDLDELRTLAVAVAVAASVIVVAAAAVAVALSVRHQTAGQRGDQVLDEVVKVLKGGKNRPTSGDGIVLQLLRDQGFGKSQLIFLKMNLVPLRLNPKQRWPLNKVFEVSLS
ncbi:serine arginine repetitive matrix 1 [Fusarium heterosporum]|uniref:Serine arginine repetitive matrix 1 n=1 Tax=Fusarium heterosporum TaxID=42747 RepID=A0A8H5TR36_FUSHE|nr:serine arginine repetitive matrix 1 [Fusarium heterosporum]